MAQDITPYEVREYQRAVNAWDSHHVHDLLGPIHVDSVLGAKSKAVGLRAAWYFGVGHPWISNANKGFTRAQALAITDWLRHPSHFYSTHKLAHAVGTYRIKAERAKRIINTHTGGITTFDGVRMAGWIADVLIAARRAGVSFGVSSGYRSIAEQWYLYNHPEGYPVAYPGSSHHNGYVYPDGAVDCYSGQYALSNWLRSHPNVARGLTYAGSKDAVHFSVPGSHHAGEGSY